MKVFFIYLLLLYYVYGIDLLDKFNDILGSENNEDNLTDSIKILLKRKEESNRNNLKNLGI
jgi:hypothetical protein